MSVSCQISELATAHFSGPADKHPQQVFPRDGYQGKKTLPLAVARVNLQEELDVRLVTVGPKRQVLSVVSNNPTDLNDKWVIPASRSDPEILCHVTHQTKDIGGCFAPICRI